MHAGYRVRRTAGRAVRNVHHGRTKFWGSDVERFIDTDKVSGQLRPRMIDLERRAISLTRFDRSDQAGDLSEPPNCGGFGRVHLFETEAFDDWPPNPLPIRPASRALGMAPTTSLPAQVFQNSGCNWRCWYCFVPFADLSARRGEMVDVTQLIDWDLEAHPEPHVIDLSGGQPDLTPEWTVWVLEELDKRQADHVYVWSDDNLSTDHIWTALTPAQRDFLGSHRRYGRAVCLKGYDASSFAFNTAAAPDLFDRQLELLSRIHHGTSIDYYVYLTITTPSVDELDRRMSTFLDRLQSIDESLPLRCVPLKVLEWGPVTRRMTMKHHEALGLQHVALGAWLEEIATRFPGAHPAIEDVSR